MWLRCAASILIISLGVLGTNLVGTFGATLDDTLGQKWAALLGPYKTGKYRIFSLPSRHSARAERKEWRKGWLSYESGAFPLWSALVGGAGGNF